MLNKIKKGGRFIFSSRCNNCKKLFHRGGEYHLVNKPSDYYLQIEEERIRRICFSCFLGEEGFRVQEVFAKEQEELNVKFPESKENIKLFFFSKRSNGRIFW